MSPYKIQYDFKAIISNYKIELQVKYDNQTIAKT